MHSKNITKGPEALSNLGGVKALVSERLAIIIFMMGGATVSIETVDYHMIVRGYYKLLKTWDIYILLTCVN